MSRGYATGMQLGMINAIINNNNKDFKKLLNLSMMLDHAKLSL